jgi:hypothetical protein
LFYVTIHFTPRRWGKKPNNSKWQISNKKLLIALSISRYECCFPQDGLVNLPSKLPALKAPKSIKFGDVINLANTFL